MLFSEIVNVSSLCKKKEPKRLKESDGSSKNLKIYIFLMQSLTIQFSPYRIAPLAFLNSTPRKNIGHVPAKILVSVDSY